MKRKHNKAAFVRSLPATTPAKEVVAKAKAAGFTLSDAYVYNIRATENRKARGGDTLVGKARAGHFGGVASVRGRQNDSSAANLLRAIASELGLARAISVLETERARVLRMVGA